MAFKVNNIILYPFQLFCIHISSTPTDFNVTLEVTSIVFIVTPIDFDNTPMDYNLTPIDLNVTTII